MFSHTLHDIGKPYLEYTKALPIHILLSRVVARYVTLLDRNRYNIVIEKKMRGWLVVVAVATIVITRYDNTGNSYLSRTRNMIAVSTLGIASKLGALHCKTFK